MERGEVPDIAYRKYGRDVDRFATDEVASNKDGVNEAERDFVRF